MSGLHERFVSIDINCNARARIHWQFFFKSSCMKIHAVHLAFTLTQASACVCFRPGLETCLSSKRSVSLPENNLPCFLDQHMSTGSVLEPNNFMVNTVRRTRHDTPLSPPPRWRRFSCCFPRDHGLETWTCLTHSCLHTAQDAQQGTIGIERHPLCLRV